MSGQEQRRNTTNIENQEGESISSGIYENNISQKTIEQEYKDTEAINRVMEHARNNQVKLPSNLLIDVKNKAKELVIKDIPVKMVESWENIGINNI